MFVDVIDEGPLSHKAVEVALSELIRITDMGRRTTEALLLLFSAAALAPSSLAAVCPHEDGSFENWSDPGTWGDGKVMYKLAK